MKIRDAIEIHGGGPGSGPNAPCPQCGPKSKGSAGEPSKFDVNKLPAPSDVKRFNEYLKGMEPSEFRLKPPNPSSVPQPPNTRQQLEQRHAELMSRYGANLSPDEQWELEHWNKLHPDAPMYPKDWKEYEGKKTTHGRTGEAESWPEADAMPRTAGGGFMSDPARTPTPESTPEEEEKEESGYHEEGDEEDEVITNPIRRSSDASSDEKDEVEQAISSNRAYTYKNLGGGVSTSKIVMVADSKGGKIKCVWKPDSESGGDRDNISHSNCSASTRELGCWEVAKLVGMTDLVNTHCVQREYEGDEGSMCYFQPGERADEANNAFDGKRDTARAAAFDYVVGNEDRHQGNWVITPDGKYGLIDHNLTFPEGGPYYRMNAGILRNAPSDLIPKDFAEPYVKNRMAIQNALKRIGIPSSAVEAVNRRITTLSKATHWYDLDGDEGSVEMRRRNES